MSSARTRSFACPVTGCGRRCQAKKALERHLRLQHAARGQCSFPECTAWHTTPERLELHILVQHGEPALLDHFLAHATPQ